MGRTSYTTLKERADAAATASAQAVELTPQEEQRRIAALIADRERAKLAEEAAAAKSYHAERGEIHIKKVIDAHEGRLATVTSFWTTITPSMCAENATHGYGGGCGWDAAKARGFKNGWDSIPEDMVLPWNGKTARQDVEELLAQHKAIEHPTSGGVSHIRTPEQARAAHANRPVPETFVENPRLK